MNTMTVDQDTPVTDVCVQEMIPNYALDDQCAEMGGSRSRRVYITAKNPIQLIGIRYKPHLALQIGVQYLVIHPLYTHTYLAHPSSPTSTHPTQFDPRLFRQLHHLIIPHIPVHLQHDGNDQRRIPLIHPHGRVKRRGNAAVLSYSRRAMWRVPSRARSTGHAGSRRCPGNGG